MIIDNSYGANNCTRAIVQNLQIAHLKSDETTSAIGITAADLLDFSLNKLFSGAVGNSPSSSSQ
jgi:hypothetical protein